MQGFVRARGTDAPKLPSSPAVVAVAAAAASAAAPVTPPLGAPSSQQAARPALPAGMPYEAPVPVDLYRSGGYLPPRGYGPPGYEDPRMMGPPPGPPRQRVFGVRLRACARAQNARRSPQICALRVHGFCASLCISIALSCLCGLWCFEPVQVGVLFAERMDQMGLEVVVRDVYENTPAAATGERNSGSTLRPNAFPFFDAPFLTLVFR